MVCTGIAAPIATERNNPWFKLRFIIDVLSLKLLFCLSYP